MNPDCKNRKTRSWMIRRGVNISTIEHLYLKQNSLRIVNGILKVTAAP